MAVLTPIGHDETIALEPTQPLISRDGLALALNDKINCPGGVAVRFGFFVAAQHLNVAIHGRERGAAGDRIDIFKDHPVVRAAILRGPP